MYSVIQLIDGRVMSGSNDKSAIKIWDTISGSRMVSLEGYTYSVFCVTQLTDGRIVSASADYTIRIWNIMSLSQQKWIRRRLLVLLFEVSKILIEPPKQFEKIHLKHQYRRRHELELLLHCSLLS